MFTIQASINKLKREAAERGSREASVLSDAGDETESIGSNSDAFGDPIFQRERKRYQMATSAELIWLPTCSIYPALFSHCCWFNFRSLMALGLGRLDEEGEFGANAPSSDTASLRSYGAKSKAR